MIKDILIIISLCLLVDFGFYCLWAVSGQIPTDNYFIGSISYHIISLIF